MQLVSSHGMLAILEVLEGKYSREYTLKLLQIINRVGGFFFSSLGGLLLAVLIDYWKLPFGCLQPSFSLVGERRFGIFGEFLFDWVRPPPRFFLRLL